MFWVAHEAVTIAGLLFSFVAMSLLFVVIVVHSA